MVDDIDVNIVCKVPHKYNDNDEMRISLMFFFVQSKHWTCTHITKLILTIEKHRFCSYVQFIELVTELYIYIQVMHVIHLVHILRIVRILVKNMRRALAVPKRNCLASVLAQQWLYYLICFASASEICQT